jgi:hypothetical protein
VIRKQHTSYSTVLPIHEEARTCPQLERAFGEPDTLDFWLPLFSVWQRSV